MATQCHFLCQLWADEALGEENEHVRARCDSSSSEQTESCGPDRGKLWPCLVAAQWLRTTVLKDLKI